jgi:isopentenyl-diphosphate delta-isomerase type 1
MKTTDNQEEMFIVVDRKDNVIGYRSRYDCHHDKKLIHRSVGALIFNDQGELLMQKRSLTKDTDPGHWDISTAGHVRKGNSYDETIRREIKEELGIETSFKQIQKRIFEMSTETEMGVLYQAKFNGKFHPNKIEVDRVKFFRIHDLRQKIISGEVKVSACAKINLVDAGILTPFDINIIGEP